MAYNESGEHDKAIVCCERSLTLKPENPEALNHLGNALKQLGKVEDSIECYQRAIALKPDFLLAMSNLADSFRRLGRGGEAEKMDERSAGAKAQRRHGPAPAGRVAAAAE